MEASGERTPHGYGSPTPTDIENCLMTDHDRGRRYDLLPEFHRALSANHAFVILSSEQQWRDCLLFDGGSSSNGSANDGHLFRFEASAMRARNRN